MNAKKLLGIKFNHGAENLQKALGISRRRYLKIIEDAVEIFIDEERYTRAVEKVAEKYSGDEFILALLVIGYMIALDTIDELEEMLKEEKMVSYID